jgi:type IV pilus assembly protein PilQ
MRLKQLLVVLPLLVLASVAAWAVTPELTNVAVVGQGNTTTVTLRASGAFTHTEYRPADDLLLINLQGLSAGKLQDRVQELQTSGARSYRVFGFTGPDGNPIVRVELKLVAKPDVRVNEGKDGLLVELVSSAAAPAPATAAAAPVPATPVPAASGPVELRQIRVAQGAAGVEIQLFTSQPVTAKTMKLAHPNRLVVDLPAGVLANVPRVLSVNQGDVRSVRVGRFQQRPPVTRVVVDLKAARDFDLVADGNNLTLKPRVLAGSKPAAPATAAPALAAETKIPASKLAKGSDADSESKGGGKPDPKSFVLLEPKVQERTGNSPDPTPTPALTAANNALSAPLQQAPAPAPQTQSRQQAPTAVQPAVNFAADQRRQTGPGAPLGPKYTGEPISVRLKDADLRDFFLMISELSGLNIFVDPSITGSLTLVLNDVPWDQALDIVLKSNGLDRQLEGNVLRIASVDNLRKEAEGRRKQLEAEALAVQKVTNTRFLSYAHSKDVLPTIKRLLSARGEAVADERTNALIIDDIPNVMPAIDTLIAQLDRKTQEVEIEARNKGIHISIHNNHHLLCAFYCIVFQVHMENQEYKIFHQFSR